MLIRKALPRDTQNVVAFYESLIRKLAEINYKMPWQVGVYPTAEIFEAAIFEQTLYLCLEGSRIIGAAILNHKQGDGYEDAPWRCNPPAEQIAVIHLLCTDPDLHKSGIGSALLNHLIGEAQTQGVKSLRLDVLHYNTPAAKLYEKAGFVKRAEVQLYYACTGTAIFWLYEKTL